jgi:hypothetical protein
MAGRSNSAPAPLLPDDVVAILARRDGRAQPPHPLVLPDYLVHVAILARRDGRAQPFVRPAA